MNTRLTTIGLLTAGLLASTSGIAAALDDITMDVVESDTGSVADITREIQLPEAMKQQRLRSEDQAEHRHGDDGSQPGDLDRDRDRDRDQVRSEMESHDHDREATQEQAREGWNDARDSQQDARPDRDDVRDDFKGGNGKGGQ